MKNKNSGKKFFVAATTFLIALLVVACPGSIAHPLDKVSMAAYIEAYRELVEENPDDFELRNQYAYLLIMSHKFEESEKQINYVIRKNPDHDMAYMLLSAIHCHRKEYNEALLQLKKIKNNKLKPERLIAEASIYLQLKNPKKSRKLARKAIKLDKSNPNGYLQAGLACQDLGEVNRAIKYIRKSFIMNPYHPLTYGYLRVFLNKELPLREQLERLIDIKKEISSAPSVAAIVSRDIAAMEKKIEGQQ